MLLSIASLVGAVLIAVGAFVAFREHAFLQKAQIGGGKVTELVKVIQSNRGGSYKPRVEFTAQDGSVHEFVSNSSSYPARFKVGDTVKVAYDASSYEGRILSFSDRFGAAFIFVLLGCTLVIARLVFAFGDQYVQRAYAPQTASAAAAQTR